MIKKIIISFLIVVLIETSIPIINISNAYVTETGNVIFYLTDITFYVVYKDGVRTISYDNDFAGTVYIDNQEFPITGTDDTIYLYNVNDNLSMITFRGNLTTNKNSREYVIPEISVGLMGISNENQELETVFPEIKGDLIETWDNGACGVNMPAQNGNDAYKIQVDVSIQADDGYEHSSIVGSSFSMGAYGYRIAVFILLNTEDSEETLETINSSLKNLNNIKASTTSDSKLGNTLNIVSGKNSASSSITKNDLASSLTGNNLTISSMTNSSGNALGNDDLIGTGTNIKLSDNTELTAVVYGDSTGDGMINALDMKDGIDSFLGNTELTDIQKESLDLKKDGEINALDLSQMVKSYLGTLEEDILVEN